MRIALRKRISLSRNYISVVETREYKFRTEKLRAVKLE